jgi:hypothetical protein
MSPKNSKIPFGQRYAKYLQHKKGTVPYLPKIPLLTVNLMPVTVAELELILWLKEGGDGTPPVVYSELNGSVNHLSKFGFL